MTPEGRARVGEVAASHVGPDRVPGLVALVSHRGEVHAEVHGSLAIGGPPVERDSLWRIASITKPLTAIVTLSLVEEGLLDLDEPVERLLPELADHRVLRRMDGPLDDTVPAQRSITTRDLLAFTFGMGMHAAMFEAPEPWPWVAKYSELGTFGAPNPDAAVDPDAWMAGVGALPLLAQPGETWLYNDGAHVLGVLLSRAAGASFPEVLRTRLTEPLGIHDTSFGTTDVTRLATCYHSTPAGLAVWDEPGGQWSHAPRFPDGAAGLVSTADDLMAVAHMLMRGGHPVLSPASVKLMTSPQTTEAHLSDAAPFLENRRWGFGLAVEVEGDRAGAFGWDGGLGTSWQVDPIRDLAVVVMTQRMFDSPTPTQVHADIRDAAYAAI